MRILKLVAENVKRLTAIEIVPKDGAVVIGGPNEAGKTSVLDSIMMVLGGAGTHPPKPIREGAKKATIAVDIGDDKGVKLTVRKEIKAKGTVNLVVESADGKVQRSPQAMLDAIVGAISFDPLAFARMKPAAQIETLRALDPSLDFSKMDERRGELYEERRVINRQAKEASAVASDLQFFPNAPTAYVDVANLTLYRGAGCPECQGTGYKGRLGIFELMEMDGELRDMAFHRTATNKIRDQAIASGMRTLMQDGVRKVLQGVTTIDEVLRITAGDMALEAAAAE